MANQIIWAMRSDNASFNARYSPDNLTPGVVNGTSGTAPPLYEADAAAIGGNRFNLGNSSAQVRSLNYACGGVFNTKTISILIRAQVLSSALLGMYDINSEPNVAPNRFAFYQNASVWKCVINDKNGVSVSSSPSLATQAPDTTHYADFVLTWDGTTTANAIKFWYNASNLGNATGSVAWANPQDPTLSKYINIGSVNGGVTSAFMYVNEMVIWNYVINPTSVALVSGIGSLNGSSRTSFVDVTSFSGTTSTDPGIANVRNATAYTINGVALTGNVVVPTVSQVKTGVTYDTLSSLTGTYDGSDRWSDPGVSNVRLSTAYQANSLTNNRTGTITIPTAGQVQTGVTFGASLGLTGTYDGSDRWSDPGVANVRLTTAYQANSLTNNRTGTVTIPTAAQVQIGVTFGASLGLTGTYDGSDRWTDPGASNVKVGVTYKANSLTANQTGTYDGSDRWTDPGTTNVKVGVTYKANSVTVNQTGTYDGSDRWTDPGVNNVRSGTAYKANSISNNQTGNMVEPTTSQVKIGVAFGTSSSLTGTYDGSDRWTDPGASNVQIGIAYKANSLTNNQTGTYDGSNRWSDPGSANVLLGVQYKANSLTNNETGTLTASASTDPGVANVTLGVHYEINSVPLVGIREVVTNVIKNATLVGQNLKTTLEEG